MIAIEFNGKTEQVEGSTTIMDLLEQAGVNAGLCAVEVNLEIVPKSEYASKQVCDGDRIEVVTLVGGG